MNLTKAWRYAGTQITKWKYAHVGKCSYVGKPLYIQRKSISISDRVRIYPGLRAEFSSGLL